MNSLLKWIVILAAPVPLDRSVELDKEDIVLEKYRILPRSPLIGQTIRETALREKATALVAGIERGDKRLVNPDGTTAFQQNDLLWLVGSKERIHRFMEERKAARE